MNEKLHYIGNGFRLKVKDSDEPVEVRVEAVKDGFLIEAVKMILLGNEYYTNEEILSEQVVGIIKKRIRDETDADAQKLKVIAGSKDEIILWILTEAGIYRMTLSYKNAMKTRVSRIAIANSPSISQPTIVTLDETKVTAREAFEDRDIYIC